MNTYSLAYRADLHILFLRWLQPSTLDEAQDSYRAALALAQEHRCGNWLLDSRRSGPIQADETVWLSREFFPQALGELAPAPLRLGVFTSMQRLEQMRTDPAVTSVVQAAIAATQPYDVALFMVEADVVDWLLAPAP